MEETELVVCINSRDIFIECCYYSGGYTLELYRRIYDIKLYEAATGFVVAHTTIQGSMPEPCGFSEFFIETNDKVKKRWVSEERSESHYAEFEAWLKPYVE